MNASAPLTAPLPACFMLTLCVWTQNVQNKLEFCFTLRKSLRKLVKRQWLFRNFFFSFIHLALIWSIAKCLSLPIPLNLDTILCGSYLRVSPVVYAISPKNILLILNITHLAIWQKRFASTECLCSVCAVNFLQKRCNPHNIRHTCSLLCLAMLMKFHSW